MLFIPPDYREENRPRSPENRRDTASISGQVDFEIVDDTITRCGFPGKIRAISGAL
jgi:hypothetical protein